MTYKFTMLPGANYENICADRRRANTISVYLTECGTTRRHIQLEKKSRVRDFKLSEVIKQLPRGFFTSVPHMEYPHIKVVLKDAFGFTSVCKEYEITIGGKR